MASTAELISQSYNHQKACVKAPADRVAGVGLLPGSECSSSLNPHVVEGASNISLVPTANPP